MSNAVSRGHGRGKPNQGFFPDHNVGHVDPAASFALPVVAQQVPNHYPRMHPNQMPQQPYQQYGGAPQQYNPPQGYYNQPPPPMHQQPQQFGGYNQQAEFVPRQMYQQNQFHYQGQHPVYQSDTVNFQNNTQHPPPMQTLPEPRRQRKLLEIVDPTTKKAIDVPPLKPATVPPPPVIPVTIPPPAPADDEKKRDNVNRELREKVRNELTKSVDVSMPIQSQPPAARTVVLPDMSHPPPLKGVPPPSVVQATPQVQPPQPKTPEAPVAKPEAVSTQPETVTPVSSPQAPETATATPASGTAESASVGADVRVTPTLQKEESKEEVEDDKFEEEEREETPEAAESQVEKSPEELAEEKAQKEEEEKEKKRLQEEALESKIDELINSNTVSAVDGMYGREFMVTIREIEKLFSRTPCPLSPQQLADFGLDIKTMRVHDNKKPNFTPNWVVPNKGQRNTQPYRGRTTTDGTGRGAPQSRDQRGHPKRPPVVRQSIERVQRIALPSSKDAWKPDRQKASDNVPEDEAAIREVCKKVRALMNKVTPTSQKPLTEEFIGYNVSSNENQLSQVVEIVFDKAVEEPKFCALYAEMCKAQVTSELLKNNGKSMFRNTVLTRTQKVFQDKRDIDEEKLAAIEREEDPVRREAMLVDEKQKFRRRRFGVMGFIGHLYRNTLLSTTIIHACSLDLFSSILPKKAEEKDQPLKKDDIDEESVHCGLQLIETVGASLDKSKDGSSPAFLDQWFQKLEIAKPLCSNKIRFMIMNLIELRKDKWLPRKSTESGPKKLDEIHKDIQKEKIDNEKARDQYDRDRDRRHGGGVRPNSNSLRKQPPPSRNSLERNRNTQQPEQKRAAAAANTKLQTSNVAPKNISLSSMDNATLGKSKKEWHSGASGGGNSSEMAAAAVKPTAWGRRDSNDQRKKSSVDDRQAAISAAKEMTGGNISVRRSTSQTSIPDKIDDELTEEEKVERAKIMNTVNNELQEVAFGALTLDDLVTSIKEHVGQEKYGKPSLTVVFEMCIRSVSDKSLKENERKILASAFRLSLASKADKQAFIDGVTRFCKYAVDMDLYYDHPNLWSVIAEILMNTMHVHHEVIEKAREKASAEIETISLNEMGPAFLAAKTDGKKKFDLFVQLMKRWTEDEFAENGNIEALSWEFDELSFKGDMVKDGLRTEMEAVTTNNGKTLAELLLK